MFIITHPCKVKFSVPTKKTKAHFVLYKLLKWGVAVYVVKYMYNKGEKLCTYVQHIGDKVTFGILLHFGIVIVVGRVHDYVKERMCRIKSVKSK